MNKKVVLKISGTIVLAIVTLTCIFLLAPSLPNQRDNGFNRKWIKDAIEPFHQQKTNIPVEDICGVTDQNVFITTNNPRCLIRHNYNLDKFDSIFFPVNITPEVMSNRNFVIDSPWTCLFINNQPGFILGKMNDSMVQNPSFTGTPQLFIQSTWISPSSAVIRTFDSLQTKQILQKITCSTGEVNAEEPLFAEQPDMGFATGGILKFDRTQNILIYVQFYQNNFFVLDTNLVVLHRFNTIDTSFTNSMTVKQVKIAGVEKIVPSKARITANKGAFAADGFLYVHSGLRADNESLNEFNNNTVIDIYQINTGIYTGSFYIPNVDGNRLKSFVVRKDKLIVLYKTNVSIFTLSLPFSS
jgi:hypothetical protein